MDIGRNEIKEALWKSEFRELFPDLAEEIKRYFSSPNCGRCFYDLYMKIRTRTDELKGYFGEDIFLIPEKETRQKKINMTPSSRVRTQSKRVNPFKKKTAMKPVGRVFKVFNIEEVDSELEKYPPPRYQVESTSLSGGKVSFVFLEWSQKDNSQPTGAGQVTGESLNGPPQRREIYEALSALRKSASKEALKHLDTLEKILVPDPSQSK